MVNINKLGEGNIMLRTITIGSYISVQGVFLRVVEGGKIAIGVGDRSFIGTPVN